MDNIRTRNDATPAPKLPLTWDDSTQAKEAAGPTQEQLPQEMSMQEEIQRKSPAQEEVRQDQVVKEPSAQELVTHEPPAEEPPAEEQVAHEPPAEGLSAQEQVTHEPPAEGLSAQEQVKPELPPQASSAPPAQEEPVSSEPSATVLSSVSGSVQAAQPMDEQEILTLKKPDEPTSVILTRARSARGVSRSDVCKKVFVTQTFIVALEQGNFRDLPPKEQCLAQIERLCREYDISAVDIVAKFDDEYKAYCAEKKSTEKSLDNPLAEAKHPGYGFSPRSRQINLPSILIILFVLFLMALFGYAFYSYNIGRLSNPLNIDLSEHVPIHKPKSGYLDEIRVRK